MAIRPEPCCAGCGIWAAIDIGAERLGHALSAQHDAELLKILAQKQIPLELNVTSNIRTGCCVDFEKHPVKNYFDAGLMITCGPSTAWQTSAGVVA